MKSVNNSALLKLQEHKKNEQTIRLVDLWLFVGVCLVILF